MTQRLRSIDATTAVPGRAPLLSLRSAALLTVLLCGLALLLPARVHALSDEADTEPGGSILAQYVPTPLTSRNGLPENSVRSIVQGTDGYMWLGTEEGLVRYDGTRTRVFDRGTDPLMRDNYVRSITAGLDGELWVATKTGIGRYAHGAFVSHLQTTDFTVRSIVCDPTGTLWIGTDTGLYTLRKTGGQMVRVAGIPPAVAVRQLVQDADGLIWIATSDGLWSIRNGHLLRQVGLQGLPDTDVKRLIVAADRSIWLATATELVHWRGSVLKRLSLDRIAPHTRVSALLLDTTDRLWIGTQQDGIAILQGDRIFHYRASDGLPVDTILTFYKDRDDNLWVGMNGGGSLRFHAGLFITYGVREGLAGNSVFLARTTRDGSVWTATLNRSLNRLLPDGRVEVLGAKDGLPPGIIGSMFEDTDGTLWVGSNMGDLIHVQGRHLTVFHNAAHSQDTLSAILRGPEGDLYLLYPTQFGLTRFRNGKFLVETNNIPGHPAAADRAADGSLWIAADKGGVTHWNGTVLEMYGPRQGLTTDLINSILVDREGTVWVGSSADGLFRIHDGRVTQYTPKNGLSDYTVGTVTDDLHGWLWITSNKGLYKVSKLELNDVAAGRAQRLHGTVYGVPDGMRSAECNYGTSPSASLAPNGRLWFASGEGLVSILPSASTSRSGRPDTVIEGTLVDGVRTEGGAPLTTLAGSHDVQFDFTAPDFAAPERLHYRYMLQGFDRDWQDAGHRSQAFYTRLPPGSYTFLVQGTDGAAWPTHSATMAVVVTPHFWQTNWFSFVAFVLFLLCGWAGYEVRVVALRRSQRVLQEQVVARTAALQHAMRQAEAAHNELQELATRDSMTRLWNRRHILTMLRNEANRAERENLSLCVLMLDVDHFKNVNDTRGHLAGDRVLQAVGNVLIEQTRPYDCAGRYGGEEFLVILCNCSLEHGVKRADSIREAIAKVGVDWNGEQISVTASFGVALHGAGKSMEAVLQEADETLYRAKANGRNRVCVTDIADIQVCDVLPHQSHPQAAVERRRLRLKTLGIAKINTI